MPSGLSGPLRELMVGLHELHALAGWPSVRKLEKELSVSHFTIHQVFTEPDLPKATVYAEVVAALARRSPWGDEDEICDRMSRLWLAAYQYKALDLEPSINRMPAGEDSSERGPAATTRNAQLAPRELVPRSITPTDLLERHPDLPSLGNSCAVIVGVGRFRDSRLVNLPGVVRGAEALHALLTSDVPAFLPDTTIAVPDGSRLEVLNAVHDAAEKATDTLLLYYAGHGLLTSSGSFNLAASDAEYDRPFTAIPYDDVREALATSRARRKALILDCCFSGRAVQGSMGTVAELAAATGTYVLSSTSSARAAIASPSKRYPDFTGMLLDILERGVKGGPELLDVQTIYHTLRERLASQGSPQPEMTSRGGARLALGVNHAADDV
jgi:hypothetical protein